MPDLPFDWTQVVGVVVVFFGAAFFYLQLRHRPQATKEVKTAADLRSRIRGNPYTLVQLFAPL
jgi:protein-S-isoprenylcysteine O-methyltransferase Ste14